MRHRADRNQAEIVRALQKIGATVENTNMVGNGFPDLVVSYFGQWHLIEIKAPKGKLLDTQKRFHEEHSPAPIHIVRTVDDVIKWSRVIGRAQKWRKP